MKQQTRHVREQGAATLVVVMVLFLIMALLAAYANRSMLFEQRVAASYFRVSSAQEVAEGGLEWVLAQLNGTAIDNACKPVDNGQRFAERYLQIEATERHIAPRSTDIAGIIDCARDIVNDGWACRCPAATAVHSVSPGVAGEQQLPSFGVMMAPGARAGTFGLTILGCTDSVLENCRAAPVDIGKAQLAKSYASTLVGLVGAVRNPPASPLVVRQDIAATGAGRLGLHNTDPRSAGLLATLGGTWTGKVDSRLESVPGTAPSQVVIEKDLKLKDVSLTGDDVFKMFMGASSTRYPSHPALRKLDCGGDCATAIEDAYKAGKRILWVDGNLSIGTNKVLGSVDDPVLVIASGQVALTGAFQLNGMLVSLGNLDWVNTSGSASLITGIVLVGGTMTTNGSMDIVYQQAVADQLRNRMGSYVRVAGGWQDAEFQ